MEVSGKLLRKDAARINGEEMISKSAVTVGAEGRVKRRL